MSRYIDADDFFRTFSELDIVPYNTYPSTDVVPRERFDRVMDNLKAVLEERDVRENVKGEWIPLTVELVHDLYGEPASAEKLMCSFCSFTFFAIDGHSAQYNYCPNCGARMVEE